MSKHTPGPWTACDNNGYSIWRITAPKYRAESASRTVAEVVGDSAETEANARLIAAAPEMLELIQALAVGYDEDDGQGIYQRIDDFIDFTHQAQALLAKIEGGGDE